MLGLSRLKISLMTSAGVGGSFSPATLFAASEPGGWYDPSDLSTLFQDSAGTTPVTAPGQTVGMVLDKSQGLVLGPELVSNTGPFANATGWTCGRGGATISVSDSKLRLTSTTGAPADIQFTLTGLTVGTTYRLSYSGVLGTAPNFRLRASSVVGLAGGNQVDIVFAGNANGNVLFVANASTMYVGLLAGFTGIGQFIELVSAGTKELPGNHLTQSTLSNRPIYGVEPVGGRRNLLTYTEQFDNAVWVKNAATITANAIIAPDGAVTADKLVEDTSTGAHRVNPATAPTIVSGLAYTATVYAKAAERTQIRLIENATTGAFASFDIVNGTVLATGAGGSGAITSAGNGWYRCELRFTSAGTFGRIDIVLSNAGSIIYTGVAGSGAFIWGAQLETGSTATAYQRVTDQWNVTEAGKTSVGYLQFDGSDDWLVSPTITPGIDKAQVFAGVRKLSDAGDFPVIVESSANSGANNGSLTLCSNAGIGVADYYAVSRGTIPIATDTPNSFAAPITNVVTMQGDISAPSVSLRVNGAASSANTASQGTGNYLAYPLYVGRRGGTTLPYNGRIYSLIVRFGANLDAATIAATEAYVNSKTGAY